MYDSYFEKMNILESFGFSKLQAKIFVTNCSLGIASAKEIMTKCEMHKVEVYRVLYELEKMGAVERILSHPTKFKCKPAKEVINNLIVPKIKLLSKINSEKEEMIDWLEKLSEDPNGQNNSIGEGFELYRGKLALKKMVIMLDSASNNIKSIADTTGYEEAVESGVAESIKNKIREGVEFRSILNVEKSRTNIIKKLLDSPNTKRRYSNKAYSWMTIVDDNKIIFSSAPKALPDEEFIYTENKQFINHYINNFEKIWNESITMEERVRELERHEQITTEPEPIIDSINLVDNEIQNDIEKDFEIYQELIAEQKMIELGNKANNEILYIARTTGNFLNPEMVKTFNDAIKRGVFVKGIFELSGPQLQLITNFTPHKQVERRHLQKVYTTMLIFDKKEIIFSSSPEPLPGEDFIYSSNKDFIKHNLKIFDSYWGQSVPFEDTLRQMNKLKKVQ